MLSLLQSILKSPYSFWALLALPSVGMIAGVSNGADPERLLHPSGEFAARFMIIAMLISPLQVGAGRSDATAAGRAISVRLPAPHDQVTAAENM